MRKGETIWESQYYRLAVDGIDETFADMRIEIKTSHRFKKQSWRGLMRAQMIATDIAAHGETVLQRVQQLHHRRVAGWQVREKNRDEWKVVLTSPSGIRCATAAGEYTYSSPTNHINAFLNDLEMLVTTTEPENEVEAATRKLQHLATGYCLEQSISEEVRPLPFGPGEPSSW